MKLLRIMMLARAVYRPFACRQHVPNEPGSNWHQLTGARRQMLSLSVRLSPIMMVLMAVAPAMAQQTDVSPEKPRAITQQTIDALIARLAAHEARIKELEEKLARQNGASAPKPVTIAAPAQP